MSDLRFLSEAQLAALGVLEVGGTTTRAAQAAGVSRQTVSSWCNHHTHFIAERNRRKMELVRAAQSLGAALLDRSLRRAADLLPKSDLASVTTLIKVLLSERSGLVGPVGPTSSGEVVNQLAGELHREFLATAELPDWAVFAIEDSVNEIGSDTSGGPSRGGTPVVV